jgi:hypothetical protein
MPGKNFSSLYVPNGVCMLLMRACVCCMHADCGYVYCYGYGYGYGCGCVCVCGAMMT